jgi:hypothetical protein
LKKKKVPVKVHGILKVKLIAVRKLMLAVGVPAIRKAIPLDCPFNWAGWK